MDVALGRCSGSRGAALSRPGTPRALPGSDAGTAMAVLFARCWYGPAATVPVACAGLVNRTALPGIRATAGVGAALANPLPPTIVLPMIAARAGGSDERPGSGHSSLSVLWWMPRREVRFGHSRALSI